MREARVHELFVDSEQCNQCRGRSQANDYADYAAFAFEADRDLI